MGIKFTCDGCGEEMREADTVLRGRLDPCAYCPVCATRWDLFEQAESVARVKLIREFQAWRQTELDALRQALTKVPDD